MFGVREVWVWRDERIEVHALRVDRYERIAHSEILPALDLDRVAHAAASPNQSQAVREFRGWLRGQ